MLALKNIISWVLDPKNRSLIVSVAFIVLLFFLLSTCDRAAGLKREIAKNKEESQRIVNNYEASRDTLKMYQEDNGNLVGKIQGYEITVSELKKNYGSLFGKHEDLKKKPPITITKVVTVIRDSLIEVVVNSTGDSTGGELEFSDSTFFSEGNWRNLSGKIPYSLDNNLSNPLVPGEGSFEIGQSISLSTTLTKDKETGKIMIKVETSYPGVTFSNIQGASILDDDENKKMWRQARKTWSIGGNVGYGVLLDIKNSNVSLGPYYGVGITYSPKWLQWGK
jgi:hypothetical protein